VGTEDRLDALDQALWTYADDSFLPHGSARTGYASDQPVYLTLTDETPNGAGVRFFVDGAEAREFKNAERFVYVFDGRDPDAVASARGQWAAAKAAGCAVTYWQQSQSGRWEQKG
jgi:DNA polymerase-3 subunit chi